MSDWDDWKRQQLAKISERLPKSKPVEQKSPVLKRQITQDELARLRELCHVRTAWWCGDKRFIQQFKAASLDTQITERQAFYIRILWYKYRKQLGHDGPRPDGYMG